MALPRNPHSSAKNSFAFSNKTMKKKIPFLPVILGTVIVVISAFAVAFGLAFFARWVLGIQIKDTAAAITLAIPSATVFLIYFFMFEGIMFTMQAKAFKKIIEESNPLSKKTPQSERKFKIITRSIYAVIISLCLIFPAVYTTCYTRVEESKITEQMLFSKTEYTLSDISSYRLGTNDLGVVFYVNMYNGDKFELLQSDSVYSEKFGETYENKYEFVAHLTDIFDENEKIIKGQVTSREEIESIYSDYPEVWTHIKKIIDKNE